MSESRVRGPGHHGANRAAGTGEGAGLRARGEYGRGDGWIAAGDSTVDGGRTVMTWTLLSVSQSSRSTLEP